MKRIFVSEENTEEDVFKILKELDELKIECCFYMLNKVFNRKLNEFKNLTLFMNRGDMTKEQGTLFGRPVFMLKKLDRIGGNVGGNVIDPHTKRIINKAEQN